MIKPDTAIDPDSDLDYKAEWTAWLAEGETIANATWILSTNITGHDESHDDTTATIWLTDADATSVRTVTATCRITTNQGRTDDRTITLFIQER